MDAYSEQDRAIARRPQHITRREAIGRVTLMLGGITLVGGTSLLEAHSFERRTSAALQSSRFTPDDIAFLDEVADTILPDTETPGAKAAATGAFMALTVDEVYTPEDQVVFRAGMTALEEASIAAYGVGFVAAAPAQRLALLERLDREAKAWMDARAAARRGESSPVAGVSADSHAHWFRMMKELALLGYFTSEIGYTQAMRYEETPGRFEPCTPHAPGDRIWAPHA